MLWSSLDNDLVIDPEFNALEELQPGAFWLFIHVLHFARVTNYGGKVLNRGKPIDAVALSRAAHRTAEDCESFFKLSVSLGILELEGKTYAIADWSRWHIPYSDTPEAAAERKRRERERKMEALRTETDPPEQTPETEIGVTGVTVTEVTNVTTYSTAQHSTAQGQHSTEQQPPPTPSAGGDAAAEDSESAGRDRLKEMFLELQPGGLSDKFFRDVGSLRRAPGATEPDVLAAARAAIAKTKWMRDRSREPIARPPAYALELARSNLPEAIERRKSNEARAGAGLPTAPYVWTPPEEESAVA